MKKLKLVSLSVTKEKKGCLGRKTTTKVYAPKKWKPKKWFTFRWFLGSGIQSYVEGYMARITTEEQVSVVVTPVTPGNHPAKIDGDVTFTSSDESVATVVSTGQFGAMVTAVSKGAAQITATFDADLGEGLRSIELSGAVEVVDAEAITGVLEFGTPELVPVP